MFIVIICDYLYKCDNGCMKKEPTEAAYVQIFFNIILFFFDELKVMAEKTFAGNLILGHFTWTERI